MGGEFTFLFWGMAVVVGVLFPLSLEVYELIPHFISHVAMREHNPWISGAVTVSVLAGGFVLRYVVVYAGQMAKIITTHRAPSHTGGPFLQRLPMSRGKFVPGSFSGDSGIDHR